MTGAQSEIHSALKKTLGELSLQRSEFAAELQQAEINLGEQDPKNSGSASGAIHRGWINLKTAISEVQAAHDEVKKLRDAAKK